MQRKATALAGGIYLVLAENGSIEELTAVHRKLPPKVVYGLVQRGSRGESAVKEYCERVGPFVERVVVEEVNLYDIDEVLDVVEHVAHDAQRAGAEVYLLLSSVSPVVPAAFQLAASFFGLRVVVAYGDSVDEIPVPPASVLAMPKRVLDIIDALAKNPGGMKLSELATSVEHRGRGNKRGKTDELRRRVATIDYYINRYLKPHGLVEVTPAQGEGRGFRIRLTERGLVVARRVEYFRVAASRMEGRKRAGEPELVEVSG
ncbi:MAG: hypothetical protein QI223_06550 [Candidatus Korarchaeota archaeon]|nr:hypothetical protein [Candidatus Korarchaeota archaeon]